MERHRSHAVLTALAAAALVLLASDAASAAHEKILYSFADGTDGGGPMGRLAFDTLGNFYGTTHFGGIAKCGGHVGGGCGVVFEVSLSTSTWVETPLYAFADGADGGFPNAGVTVIGTSALVGTASTGGNFACSIGCGVAYELVRSGNTWSEKVLHAFTGADGQFPNAVLSPAGAGDFFSTTWYGGAHGAGTVFQLTASPNVGWSEKVVYSFNGTQDGSSPAGGVVEDAAGDLYGTTYPYNGYNNGVAFALKSSGLKYKDFVIDSFGQGSGGENPYAGLVMDNAGNLYGTTIEGGSNGSGVVFELVRHSTRRFKEKVLHTFGGPSDGSTPYAGLTLDTAGNLYGATLFGGKHGSGTVFEMHRNAHGHYSERVLYNFTGGADGANPKAEPIVGPDGNLYGTAEGGGASGYGVIYEITP